MFSTNIYEKFALPLPAPLSRSLIISIVLQAIAAVFAITGNLLVLIVYYENPKLRTRVSSLFAINLAISDFLIGFLVLPLMILTNVCILFGEVLFLRAVIESILIPFLSSVSIWTLLGASVDRLIAMRFPKKYTHSCHKETNPHCDVFQLALLIYLDLVPISSRLSRQTLLDDPFVYRIPCHHADRLRLGNHLSRRPPTASDNVGMCRRAPERAHVVLYGTEGGEDFLLRHDQFVRVLHASLDPRCWSFFWRSRRQGFRSVCDYVQSFEFRG